MTVREHSISVAGARAGRWLPVLCASALGTLGCANDETPVCLAQGSSTVDVSEKDLVDFTLGEAVAALSPIEREAEWASDEHVPPSVAGTKTTVVIELGIDSATQVVQVAERHEDPSADGLCGNHLRAEVELTMKTADGILDESTTADLIAYGVTDFIGLSAELPTKGGSLDLPEADSLGVSVYQLDGEIQGQLSVGFNAEKDGEAAPTGRIETLLAWD